MNNPKTVDTEKLFNFILDLFFIVTLGAALAIRIQYINVDRLWPDEALYAWYAQKIFHNPFLIFSKEIIEYHPPLFSILLVLGHFFLPPEQACRAVMPFFYFLGIILIYYVGKKLSGRFTGTFCAITLSLNIIYIAVSSRILIDSVMICAGLLMILSILRFDTDNSRKNACGVAIACSSLILLKWSGILVIPFLILYYSLAFSGSLKKKLARAAIPLVSATLTAILLLINNLIQLGHFLPNTTALKGLYLIKPFGYYFAILPMIIMIPQLQIFFIYSIYFLIKRRKRQDILVLVWWGVFFLGISLASEKDLRYSLIVLPMILLITGVGLEDLISRIFENPLRKKIAMIISLVFVLAYFGHNYSGYKRYWDEDGDLFVGFRPAGQWIKKFAGKEKIVLAGSPRAIRYYSGIEFAQYGGNLYPLPSKKEEFEAFISSQKVPIILEIDCWEGTQPKWVHPFAADKIQYLYEKGFKLAHHVVMQNPRSNLQKLLICIFLKD